MIERREKECRTCQGTGKAPSGGRGGGLGRIFGRSQEPEEDDRPPKGAGDEDEDEEMGGSAPSRPAAKPGAHKKAQGKDGGEQSKSGGKTPKSATSEAAADQAQSCALLICGIGGKGVHWREGQGLEVDLLFSKSCLLTTFGTILCFVGLIFLKSEVIVLFALGAILEGCGLLVNIYANYARCLSCMTSMRASG